MGYPDYLVHYNRNHDKKSGRFTYGDGDGDGIRDDHSNQSKKQSTSDGSKKDYYGFKSEKSEKSLQWPYKNKN